MTNAKQPVKFYAKIPYWYYPWKRSTRAETLNLHPDIVLKVPEQRGFSYWIEQDQIPNPKIKQLRKKLGKIPHSCVNEVHEGVEYTIIKTEAYSV